MQPATADHQVLQLYVAADEPEQSVGRPLPWAGSTVCELTYVALLTFASLVAWGWQPTLRFQPTIVGILWACLFLSGYVLGGMGRGQLRYLLLFTPLTYLSWIGFGSLTDLGKADCTVLVAVLIAGGWTAAMWKGRSDAKEVERLLRRDGRSPVRWSIWDISFLTTITACVVHAVPRMVTPWELMLAVASALLAGLLSSWIACSWAWCDKWDWWSASALFTTMAVGLAIVQLSAPAGLSIGHTIQWALSGPINVVASQGVVVLAVLFAWRMGQVGESAKSVAS